MKLSFWNLLEIPRECLQTNVKVLIVAIFWQEIPTHKLPTPQLVPDFHIGSFPVVPEAQVMSGRQLISISVFYQGCNHLGFHIFWMYHFYLSTLQILDIIPGLPSPCIWTPKLRFTSVFELQWLVCYSLILSLEKEKPFWMSCILTKNPVLRDSSYTMEINFVTIYLAKHCIQKG